MNHTLWVELVKGVQVIRLWETSDGPKKPEIAILRLPDAMYEKFHADPGGFLEEHKVFPFRLNRVDHMHSTQKKALGNKSGTMITICIHRKDCTVLSSSEVEAS
jgi:hypothetical protein